MHLLDLDSAPGVFSRVLQYLGRGNELMLALTNKQVLVAISRTCDDTYDLTELLEGVDMMVGSELKTALAMRGLKIFGRKTTLSLRLKSAGIPARSVWYFMTSNMMVDYATNLLGLQERIYPGLWRLMDGAAGRGLLAGVKMLRRLEATLWGVSTVYEAVIGGKLDVIKWLRDPNKPEGQCAWDSKACALAAAGGRLEVLKWLRQPEKSEGLCDWDTGTCEAAAREGDLKMLQWLRLPGKQEGQCPWDGRACREVAGADHMEILKWMRQPGKPEGQCPWDSDTCWYAALRGNLEMLKWLRLPEKVEGQCPWSSCSTQTAAQYGHLEVLKWLRSGGDPCPWDKTVCLAYCSSADVREWILNQD